MHDSSTIWDEFLRGIFKFSHLLIRGLIKGLSPNYAIFSSFATEMYHFTEHNVSTP